LGWSAHGLMRLSSVLLQDLLTDAQQCQPDLATILYNKLHACVLVAQGQSGKCVAAGGMGTLQQVDLLMGILYDHDKATATSETGCNYALHSSRLMCHIQELEKALRCKYVAANALNALQQVYQLMGSEAKEKAASHQAWARILLKPELGRVVEACQLLEQVALEKVQLGGSYASAQGKVQSDTAYYEASCLSWCS